MGVLLGAKSGSPSTLLAAFVLSVSFLSTEAYMQLTNIVVTPARPVEGGSVRLTPSVLPPNPVSCRWYRQEMRDNGIILAYFFEPGPATRKEPSFTGRETMRPDCSLEITRLNATDSTNYIVLIYGRGGIKAGSVKITIPGPNDVNSNIGRRFTKSNIAAVVIGSVGAIGILSVVLFLIYRTSPEDGRTFSSVFMCHTLER